jgi:dimethylamine monooxygenase subunit C
MTTPPHLVIAVGDATGLAERSCRPGDRFRALADAADAGALLDAELARLSTGWRVLAVGTERDVGLVRAAALARGALDEEITVRTTAGDGGRRLHCGHCHRSSDTDAGVGETVGCPGCGERLVVTAHRSRTHGADLGVPTVR